MCTQLLSRGQQPLRRTLQRQQFNGPFIASIQDLLSPCFRYFCLHIAGPYCTGLRLHNKIISSYRPLTNFEKLTHKSNLAMFAYDTVTEAVNGLRQRGYTIDFNLEYDCIVCHDTPISLMPDEFEIVETYRFEGNTDPADEAIVFGIQSKHGEKGILVNGFGVYTDAVSDEMVRKLSVTHKVN